MIRSYYVLSTALLFVVQGLFAMTADEVLQGVENRYVGKTSKSEMTMTLVSPDGSVRNRTLNIYRQKIDNRNKNIFILFLSPSDFKDTSYLVNEKDRDKLKWIYLSAFKNVRKIVAADFGVSFVSSDFTYEDMDDIHAEDFTCSGLKDEKIDGEAVYSIDCRKKDTNTAYSHFIVKVSKEKMVPLLYMLFDRKDPGRQIKEMSAKNMKKIQDIWTPMELTMKDLRKNSSTKLVLQTIEYDPVLPEDTFTERNMKK
ncbi:MAG: outer membrane lipoprotein-sorting protein [Candidatus Riflebacteria bacterium]|nr:outer membrane lipoprotein-sorting protein [Candidatus Riflebacteria bacterium]